MRGRPAACQQVGGWAGSSGGGGGVTYDLVQTFGSTETSGAGADDQDIDIATGLSQDQVVALQSSDGVTVKTSPAATTFYVLINANEEVGGPFANPKIQEAIRYALKYDEILALAGEGAVRLAGSISLIGVLTGAAQADPTGIMRKSLSVRGIYVGSREMFEDMNRAIASHRLRPVIDRVFPFAQAKEAFRYMESAAHFGKIVLTYQ